MTNKIDTLPVSPGMAEVFQNKANRHVIEHSRTEKPGTCIIHSKQWTVWANATTYTGFHHIFSENTGTGGNHTHVVTQMNTVPIGRNAHGSRLTRKIESVCLEERRNVYIRNLTPLDSFVYTRGHPVLNTHIPITKDFLNGQGGFTFPLIDIVNGFQIIGDGIRCLFIAGTKNKALDFFREVIELTRVSKP